VTPSPRLQSCAATARVAAVRVCAVHAVSPGRAAAPGARAGAPWRDRQPAPRPRGALVTPAQQRPRPPRIARASHDPTSANFHSATVPAVRGRVPILDLTNQRDEPSRCRPPRTTATYRARPTPPPLRQASPNQARPPRQVESVPPSPTRRSRSVRARSGHRDKPLRAQPDHRDVSSQPRSSRATPPRQVEASPTAATSRPRSSRSKPPRQANPVHAQPSRHPIPSHALSRRS